MPKSAELDREPLPDRFATRAIGLRKAKKFASVDGIELSAASQKIAQIARSRRLRGDAFRAEIAKAFKNVSQVSR